MEQTLESLVQDSLNGDKAALEELVSKIQDKVYGLALRMVWHPADAEDATQEILIRVITNLSSFRGESAFTTWVYRVASNYLLTARKRRAEREQITFEIFGEQLDQGLSDEPHQVSEEVEHRLLIDEVRIGCTTGMLLCLDRDHRLAYILREIIELTGEEGGYILDITPVAFRKRLSRARSRIIDFMQKKCGLVNQDNPCRCHQRVDSAIQAGRVTPNSLLFAEHPTCSQNAPFVVDRMQELEQIRRASAIYRSHPDYATPNDFAQNLKELIHSGQFAVFGETNS